MATVYSFDLFDTVISRKTGTPKGIFCMMQQKMQETWPEAAPYFTEHFFDIRIRAEQIAREEANREEISLNIIYQTMQRFYPAIPAGKISRLEMDLERKYSFGIRKTINTIHFLLDLGKRVIFISDMYLPIQQIREMLEKASPRFTGLPVYLSSEEGVTKLSGDLYRQALGREHLNPSDLLHTGNDPWTDIRIPAELGIHTLLCSETELLPPEQAMLTRENDLYAQLMCGASRFTRLTAHDNSDVNRTAATFSGPLFYTCIRPVLARAAEEKNAVVHFMARDGKVLKTIADAILSVHPLPVRTNYFYASRETLIMPSIRDFSERLHSELNRQSFLDHEETLHSLSQKLFLPAEAVQEFLQEKKIRRDKVLKKDECTYFFTWLSRSKYIPQIRQACEKKRHLLLEYLKELKFFSSSNFIVDIGWTGYTQTALRLMLDTIPVFCWNLLCFGGLPETERLPVKCLTRLSPVDLYKFCTSLELFCQADHGKTIGYERKDGRIQPLFRSVPPRYLDWPFERYYSGLRSFSRNFTLLLRDFDLDEAEAEPRLRKALLNILKRPPLYIAQSVGSILYTRGVLDGQPKEAAPPFTYKMLIRYFLHRNAEITNWYEGSLARSNFRLIRLNASFFQLIRKMTNTLIWLKRDGIAATCREAIRQLKTIGKRG